MKAEIIEPMTPTIIPLIKEIYQNGHSLADAKTKATKAYNVIAKHIRQYDAEVKISGNMLTEDVKNLRKKCAGVLKRNAGLGIEYLNYITIFEYGNQRP